mmetsp:Transcript_107103/g.313213  ORF Transcript_107103/g.313213 Transcript_107103/m.313213 type:complete len:138 (-) Transcript_107103:54-467(-)
MFLVPLLAHGLFPCFAAAPTMDDGDGLMLERLHAAKGVVASEDLLLDMSCEMLQPNNSAHVVKKKLVIDDLEMFADIAGKKEGAEKFYGQFGKRVKFGVHEASTICAKAAELLRSCKSKSGDERWRKSCWKFGFRES